jgi:predicted metal-dependent enzyme (double-stranded beta helix superfamily)
MMQHRYTAVLDTIRHIEELAEPLSAPETRQHIRDILQRLALRTELFPADHFNVRPGKTGGIYELYVAPNRGLSLYASAGASGKYQPPHDHTTWAVIAGVRGVEHNQFFKCVARDEVHATGSLRFVRSVAVGPGESVTLAAQDFHTIAIDDGADALHLHLYGNALDTLKGRIGFATEAGGTFTRFMAKPLTFAPWTDAKELAEMREQGLDFTEHSVDTPNLMGSLRASSDQSSPIVLTGVESQAQGDAEQTIRTLQYAGFHNLAVFKPEV